MKYIITLLIILQSSITLFSQVTTEEVIFDYQIAYCMGPENSTAWIGEKVVIMIEGETPEDRDMTTMTEMIGIFEDIITKYEEYTGLDDLPIASSFDEKPVIEVVLDNCGAGGLANHGVLGMSTGVFFLDQFYDLIQAGNIAVPQVFLYELNRNFWAPSFNDKFDWAMDDNPQNWGWWTVGMNNAQAYIIPQSLGLGLYYFGNDINYWEDRMVGELNSYIDDTQYDFDYGWTQSLMPWHNTESINDLMSGLLIYSYNNFGGDEWMTGFYEQLQNSDIADRSDVFAYEECRDNIYKVWSYAANQDLIAFFEEDLRWFITEEAKEEVNLVFNPIIMSSLEDTESLTQINIYPNPAKDILIIKTNTTNNTNIELFNNLGQKISVHPLNNKTELNISHLNNGVYWLKINNQTYPVIKK